MKKKQTTGERIVEPYVGSFGIVYDNDARAIARRIDSALKRAVREGYDAGWYDGGRMNKSNDGWNRLAKKYEMRGVE